jgi:hypothetical protein
MTLDTSDNEKARRLAEDAIEAAASGDVKKGQQMVREAQKIDKNAVAEVAVEVDEERENAKTSGHNSQ